MKRFDVSRVVVLVCALALSAFALTGCGDDKKSSGGGGGDGKSLSGEKIGDAEKVTVESDKNFDAEQQAVIEKIGEFADAANSKDYKKICKELLTKEASRIGGNCINTFKQTGVALKDFEIIVKGVTVGKDGKSATADTLSKSNLDPKGTAQQIGLQMDTKGEWRITILGQ